MGCVALAGNCKGREPISHGRSIQARALRRTSLISAAWRARNRQKIEYQKHNPNVYRCVGDVEDEKMSPKSVKIEIINDGAMSNPVNGVAESAANDQTKRCGGQCGPGSNQPPCQQRDRREGQREQGGLPRPRIAGEQAEGNAAVPPQRQIQERRERPRIDRELFRMRQDANLCDLVRKDHHERYDASCQARNSWQAAQRLQPAQSLSVARAHVGKIGRRRRRIKIAP